MTTEREPWQWDEPTWRGHVERVRAGERLVPPSWPGGARVAVAISFDPDHETIPLRDGETRPGKLAQGEYGSRVAAPRILELLAEYSVPASFFMPAVSALLHPAEVEAYIAGGHEVAVHGWIHERNMLLGRDDELDLTLRALEVLERLSGVRPVGIRTPSWDFSDNTLAIIEQLGLRYDSSLMADDEPYELLAAGRRTGIVEIPVEWIRDDAPYLMMDRYGALRPYTPPRALLDLWRDEFDAARAEGGLFQLTLHPHVIGHRSRLVVLRELIAYIAAHDDVWFATHAEVADVARARLTPAGGPVT
ncbi:MAG: polysaccharide deacetylase [Pseudonocardia sp.]|jgi:peptidoglycan/xylan/chitin deacetylase (PgdA/CDA1 family)|uniref:polysaccharide deacetylase family protein n=1 Tax=Pseudonocardia sp. TaxID=60912 RepID=UPI00261970BD|nr:polysaccharide deacetylase [Pseudonocardia sp.]MCU1628968.1 polysaccharide deacetylase [Pseudonocardia sp.]MDT7701287.1 peptidoglycan-N-acetylglucosamine deacetylase [Pseudonocardiales bacterium]